MAGFFGQRDGVLPDRAADRAPDQAPYQAMDRWKKSSISPRPPPTLRDRSVTLSKSLVRSESHG